MEELENPQRLMFNIPEKNLPLAELISTYPLAKSDRIILSTLLRHESRACRASEVSALLDSPLRILRLYTNRRLAKLDIPYHIYYASGTDSVNYPKTVSKKAFQNVFSGRLYLYDSREPLLDMPIDRGNLILPGTDSEDSEFADAYVQSMIRLDHKKNDEIKYILDPTYRKILWTLYNSPNKTLLKTELIDFLNHLEDKQSLDMSREKRNLSVDLNLLRNTLKRHKIPIQTVTTRAQSKKIDDGTISLTYDPSQNDLLTNFQ